MRDGLVFAGAQAAEAEAEDEFREAVRGVFGRTCKAAWLSGSYVYNGARPGRSDIDVVIVMDEAVRYPAEPETLERIRGFVDAYLAVHAEHDLDPDLDFPTEYVVPATIEEALGWRGLVVGGEMAQEFPEVISSDYWPGRPERWFNAWVSMTAFSKFLTGDRDYHARVKLDAWKTLARFLLLRSDGRAMTTGEMWPGLAQFGAKPSYHDFWAVEREWVARALGELEQEGFVKLEGGRIAPDMERLRDWEREVAAKMAAADGDGPLLLPPGLHREIGEYAKRRWPAISGGGS
jgi:predicted nucleotidyltransferase